MCSDVCTRVALALAQTASVNWGGPQQHWRGQCYHWPGSLRGWETAREHGPGGQARTRAPCEPARLTAGACDEDQETFDDHAQITSLDPLHARLELNREHAPSTRSRSFSKDNFLTGASTMAVSRPADAEVALRGEPDRRRHLWPCLSSTDRSGLQD